MMNLNWNRWIFASASTCFKDALSSSLNFVIEGQHQLVQDTFVEYRSDGPKWQQRPGRRWSGKLIINLLIKCLQDQNDYHKLYRILGQVEQSFGACIQVKKYGDTIVDDNATVIGILIRDSELETSNFGQVDPSILLSEATVQATYKIDLQEE